MNNWKETTLDNAICLVGGGTPRTKELSHWDGKIPWLSVVDFNNDNRWVEKTEKTITEEGLINSSTKLLDAGDLILSARGTVGELAQLKIPMAFNQSCYGIKPKKNSDINFLYYLLKWKIKNIKKNVHGAVFDTITRNTFEQISVTLPSLPEQKAIAAVLDSLDDKIELLQKQNETLEKIAQTIFKRWFVEFEFPDKNGKPYKSSGGKMIESEPGKIPEGWELGCLSDIAEITSGKRPKNISDKKNKDYTIPLIGATKVMGYVKDFIYNEDLLIIGRVGTHGIVQRHNSPIWPSDNTLVIKSDNYIFTYLILQSIDYKKMNRGAVQPLITQTDLKNYPIILPEEIKFSEFKDCVNTLFSKIKNNENQILTLSNLRDTLLPKLMGGEVRVK